MSSETISPTNETIEASLVPQVHEPRNPGMALDMDWVRAVQANTSAIERRAATLPGRRSVKKEYQAAWLLKAITLIDLTTLSGDDTEGRVRRLCAKAANPVRADILDALGMGRITTGAILEPGKLAIRVAKQPQRWCDLFQCPAMLRARVMVVRQQRRATLCKMGENRKQHARVARRDLAICADFV